MGPEGTEPGALKEIRFPELSPEVELPLEQRYLRNCVQKGRKPSERGLMGFYEVITAWILKDAVKGVETAAGPQKSRVKGTLKRE